MKTMASAQQYPRTAGLLPATATVMVVDDDESFRILARRILEAEGFAVLEASGFAECLNLLRSHRTEIIVLDIVMPEQDGIESLHELKSHHPEILVVAVSGVEASDLYLKITQHLGADASLNKARVSSLGRLLESILEA